MCADHLVHNWHEDRTVSTLSFAFRFSVPGTIPAHRSILAKMSWLNDEFEGQDPIMCKKTVKSFPRLNENRVDITLTTVGGPEETRPKFQHRQDFSNHRHRAGGMLETRCAGAAWEVQSQGFLFPQQGPGTPSHLGLKSTQRGERGELDPLSQVQITNNWKI
jgi:hypothetical protein